MKKVWILLLLFVCVHLAATGKPDLTVFTPEPGSDPVIRFTLQQESPVEIRIYNLLGQRVRTLTTSVFNPGVHELVWDGRNDAGQYQVNGVYLCRLQQDARFIHGKVILLK